jgi:Ca2+-binding EF-hand superfamily protein
MAVPGGPSTSMKKTRDVSFGQQVGYNKNGRHNSVRKQNKRKEQVQVELEIKTRMTPQKMAAEAKQKQHIAAVPAVETKISACCKLWGDPNPKHNAPCDRSELPDDPREIQAIFDLNLTRKDYVQLRKVFASVDADGSGSIEYDEFFSLIDGKRTALTDMFFRLFDADGDMSLDFSEFVAICNSYCKWKRREIERFVFGECHQLLSSIPPNIARVLRADCYDTDRSGGLEEEEFAILMSNLHDANPDFPGNFKEALQNFDQNDDGVIDFGG